MSGKIMIKVTDSMKVSISEGKKVTKPLLELLRENGVWIDAPCNGLGRCGKCKIKAGGDLLPPDEAEKKTLGAALADGWRLSCQTRAFGDFWVEPPQKGNASVSMEGLTQKYAYTPSIDVEKTGLPAYGLAVDIGTTTVAAYLLDLKDGRRVGTLGELNTQRTFGADVISRITACSEGHLDELRSLIVNQINLMAGKLCANAGQADTSRIFDVALCGNPTMQHILHGMDPEKLAVAPFIPTSLFGFEVPAAELGIKASAAAKAYTLPAISAYIGGDITADVLSCGMYDDENITLMVDVGTNGEMALGNKDGIYYCSTAAGPAFEGAAIEDGMGGIEGAIGTVKVGKNDIEFQVIGDKTPIGICGSGIIDATAVMLAVGAVDETGRLVDPDELDEKYQDRLDDDARKFIIDHESRIGLTDKDLRQVQLAKAAIAAGIDTLMHNAGVGFDQISAVWLAGGFGAHIDRDSACAIGLLPKQLKEKIHPVGNSAGEGTVRAILDQDAKKILAEIGKNAKYIELSGDPFFMDSYVENMLF